VDVDCEEMFVFLAITMLMARNKKLEIKDYWSMDQVPGDRLAKARMPLKEIKFQRSYEPF